MGTAGSRWQFRTTARGRPGRDHVSSSRRARPRRTWMCVCVTMCVCDRTPALSVCEWAARALSMASSHVCSVHTLSCGIVPSLTRRSFPVHRGVRAHCSLSAAFSRRCRVLPTRHRAQRARADLDLQVPGISSYPGNISVPRDRKFLGVCVIEGASQVVHLGTRVVGRFPWRSEICDWHPDGRVV